MIKKICTFLKSTVTIPRHAYTNVPSVKWCTFCIILIYKNKMNYLDLVNIKKHNYSFRYENTADVPSVKTTKYGLKSFRYFSTKLWNELPNHIRLEQNLNQFSKLLNTWNGGSCHCSACV